MARYCGRSYIKRLWENRPVLRRRPKRQFRREKEIRLTLSRVNVVGAVFRRDGKT